jgi:hypothetical protein
VVDTVGQVAVVVGIDRAAIVVGTGLAATFVVGIG